MLWRARYEGAEVLGVRSTLGSEYPPISRAEWYWRLYDGGALRGPLASAGAAASAIAQALDDLEQLHYYRSHADIIPPPGAAAAITRAQSLVQS